MRSKIFSLFTVNTTDITCNFLTKVPKFTPELVEIRGLIKGDFYTHKIVKGAHITLWGCS